MKTATVISMAVVLASGLRASALETRVWTARYPLLAASRVAVENVEGDIRVEAWDRAEVEITVTKTALSPAGRLDDVRVAFGFGDRTLTIQTVYTAESGEPVRVDYRLRVPREVELNALRTVLGDITVRGTEGTVDARTLYGNIAQARVEGRVIARAINGNIAVSLSALPQGGPPLILDTLNGNLELLLPPEADADLELSTVAGKIEGNYVFAVSSVPGDSTRRARLGRGGVLVRLRTVRGDIRAVISGK
jgi:hypothetical protein